VQASANYAHGPMAVAISAAWRRTGEPYWPDSLSLGLAAERDLGGSGHLGLELWRDLGGAGALGASLTWRRGFAW
jgi:hypothetical protein